MKGLWRSGSAAARRGLLPLPRAFYARPVLGVAKDCIGKILVRSTGQGTTVGRIVEAEAYRGPEDLAAHSSRGRRTSRTEVMFGPPGYAYVFVIYGLYAHFNLVVAATGEPHAILIRAVEPLRGISLMAQRRNLAEADLNLTNGPGKLCIAFDITRRDYGADLCRPEALYLADGPRIGRVARAPRIGVDYAGAWARKAWRFFDPESRYVSRRGARPS